MALPFELTRDGPDSPERVSLVPCFETAFPGPVKMNNQGRGSSDIWEPLGQSQFRGML